jgi:Putative Ig domain
MVNDRYDAPLTAPGGSPPYQWDIVEGALPVGLSLDQTGMISGVPEQEGSSRFKVQVTDAADNESDPRPLSITINPKLLITTGLSPRRGLAEPGQNFIADLHAEGGAPPYKWTWERGPKPDWLNLDSDTGRITGIPGSTGTTRFTIQARDKDGHIDTADFFINVRPRRLWRRSPKITAWSMTVRPSWREWLAHGSSLLASLGIGLPVSGVIWIFFYAFSTTGSHFTYLGVALLTSLAAFLIGSLAGFLFGIPRAVSSGLLRQTSGSSPYSPSSNLAEVSDWLTKLLLGAGLVQLTHLGAPIASLIDHVGRGLYPPGGSGQAATVMAGAILFGYAAIGLLDGYVMTTTWYQNWLIKHARQL